MRDIRIRYYYIHFFCVSAIRPRLKVVDYVIDGQLADVLGGCYLREEKEYKFLWSINGNKIGKASWFLWLVRKKYI